MREILNDPRRYVAKEGTTFAGLEQLFSRPCHWHYGSLALQGAHCVVGVVRNAGGVEEPAKVGLRNSAESGDLFQGEESTSQAFQVPTVRQASAAAPVQPLPALGSGPPAPGSDVTFHGIMDAPCLACRGTSAREA